MPPVSSTLIEGLQYQEVFVKPLVAAVKVELDAHLVAMDKTLSAWAGTINTHTTRLDSLERNQARALWGWGAFALGVPALLTAIWKRWGPK